MPVSFAVLEYESEGLKSPCAGGGSCPANRTARMVASTTRAPSAFEQRQRQTEGTGIRTTRPRENAARERRSVP